MTKEEAIKFLQQLYPNGGNCWLDEQRIEAIGMAIQALQEKPVSVWHDASEEPNDKSSCLIHYIVGGEVSYRDIFPVIYNKEVREFVSESYPHPTGYKVEQSSLEGGVVAEVYKNMRDRFPLSDIYKWTYIDDILNLSNVQRTVKNWKEPVGEDLGEYINELSKKFPDVSFAKLSRIAVRVAKWQKKQDQSIIELAEDHAMLAGMEKMKEEMMEKAVIMEAHEEYGELWGDIRRCNTEKGKRYKVIIIKED